MAKLGGYTAAAVLVVVLSVPAMAEEIQLAGIRLGQHAINLLDVWGQPDGIVVGEGAEQVTAAQAPGAAAGAPMMAQPGAGPGMGMGGPGMGGPMMGPGMGGPMMGGQGMGGPGGPMMGLPGGGGPMMGQGMGGPGMMGPGMGPGAMGGPPGAMGGPGMMGPGAGAAGAAGAAAGAAGAVPFPIWALPVWITLRPGEVEWIYQRGPVVMGFAIDRDGYITCIAVAGRECNWARTALWQPHRYVKLGDSFKRVLYRYGYPDRIDTYTASGPMTGDNSISVTFGGVNRTFSRDCILRYEEESNIAFTLHDFKVVRIHIWQR